jgi:hypothetical protein
MRMPSSVSTILACSLALLSVLAFGCKSGPVLEPVEGTVLHKGNAASGVVVTFHLKGSDPVTAIRPVGRTDADGKFTLMTGRDSGAQAGEYVVTFIWPKEVADKKKGKVFDTSAHPETVDFFDGALVDAARSKFTAVIKRGENKLEPFRLD